MAISRRTWKARAPRSRTPQRPQGVVYLHHSVDAPGKLNWTRAEEQAHMRGIQNYHMDSNGWSDIGYSFVLFPSGRLYQARGSVTVPAAQGGANTGTIAICNVGNYETQKLTKAQEERLVLALKRLKRKGYARVLRGHRQAPGQATACPGQHIMEALPRLRRKSGLGS